MRNFLQLLTPNYMGMGYLWYKWWGIYCLNGQGSYVHGKVSYSLFLGNMLFYSVLPCRLIRKILTPWKHPAIEYVVVLGYYAMFNDCCNCLHRMIMKEDYRQTRYVTSHYMDSKQCLGCMCVRQGGCFTHIECTSLLIKRNSKTNYGGLIKQCSTCISL